jgi:Tol biopolymer transport system component
VYTSRSADHTELSMVNEDGTGRKQLKDSGAATEGWPCATPDGRYIVFGSDAQGGVLQVFRMTPDGSELKQLTFGAGGVDGIACSPDSRWITFASFQSGPHTVYKVPIDGGEPVQITAQPILDCNSVAGNDLLCQFSDQQFSPPKRRMARISFESGQMTDTFDIPPFARLLSVAPDGRSFIYTSPTSGVDNLWSQPLGGGTPKQLTNLKSDGKMNVIYRIAWSQDGKRVAMVRGNTATDVVLIKDFLQP